MCSQKSLLAGAIGERADHDDNARAFDDVCRLKCCAEKSWPTELF
jgi:hypothetical protein